MPKRVFIAINGQCLISVIMVKGVLQVKYGEDIKNAPTYNDAVDQVGRAVMHALTCDGVIPESFH